jgi:hypothetical protein
MPFCPSKVLEINAVDTPAMGMVNIVGRALEHKGCIVIRATSCADESHASGLCMSRQIGYGCEVYIDTRDGRCTGSVKCTKHTNKIPNKSAPNVKGC